MRNDIARLLRKESKLAAAGENIVVLGIRPTRPETGYGYIEAGCALRARLCACGDSPKSQTHESATEFVEAGNYYWNSGMFLWSARTLANALREHLPKTAPCWSKLRHRLARRKFASTFPRLYPKCENISIDYAVLEPRSAKGEQKSTFFASPQTSAGTIWAHGRRCTSITPARARRQMAIWSSARAVFTLNAHGNYIHCSRKFVAAVGVNDLVVVETDDALLITTREQAQDVGKVVKYLDEKKLHKLT